MSNSVVIRYLSKETLEELRDQATQAGKKREPWLRDVLTTIAAHPALGQIISTIMQESSNSDETIAKQDVLDLRGLPTSAQLQEKIRQIQDEIIKLAIEEERLLSLQWIVVNEDKLRRGMLASKK